MLTKIKTNNGQIHLGGPFHVYLNEVDKLNATLAGELGIAYDVISFRPSGAKGLESIIKSHGCETAVYTKTNQGPKGLSSKQYSYTRSNGQVVLRDTGWGTFAMQPDNPDWQSHHLSELKALLAGRPDDIFSDSAGGFAYSQGGRPFIPPNYNVEYTVTQFLDLIDYNLDAWQAATGARFLINGLSSSTVDLYTPTVGMLENAFRATIGLPSPSVWQSTAQFIWDAQGKGWTPWAYVKMHGTLPTSTVTALRNFLVPTMLLLDRGSLLFELGGDEKAQPPYVTGEYKNAMYRPNMGLPTYTAKLLSEYKLTNGLYKRTFEKGVLYVNPTYSAISGIAAQSGHYDLG